MNLQGKTILVTGASSGIGQACAQLLCSKNANVIASDIQDCDETIAGACKNSTPIIQYRCDVSNEASVENLFKECFSDKPLDYLVHCAGIILEKPLLETSSADFDQIMNVNLRGSFLVGRESLRTMSTNGSGRVTMIASDLSYYGRESFSAYVASKHAVMGLVKSWAYEFAPAINVNAICPGPIDTAMLNADNMSEQWRRKELNIPLARFGRADEIAQMALYLLSPGGNFITGQGISVNGGSVMN